MTLGRGKCRHDDEIVVAWRGKVSEAISNRLHRPIHTLQMKGATSLTSCPSNALPSAGKRHFIYRSAVARLHIARARDAIATSQIPSRVAAQVCGRVEGKK
jgi:hypothetical protein